MKRAGPGDWWSAAWLRAWAYDAKARPPVEQDWEIILSGFEPAALLLELASDDRCPKQRTFLRALYCRVGDSVRTRSVSAEDVELARAGADSPGAFARLWSARAMYLFEHPEAFHHGLWCGGGLVSGRHSRPDPLLPNIGLKRRK